MHNTMYHNAQSNVPQSTIITRVPPPLEIEYWPPKSNCDEKISEWRTVHVALTDKSVNKYIWSNPAHIDTSWAWAS